MLPAACAFRFYITTDHKFLRSVPLWLVRVATQAPAVQVLTKYKLFARFCVVFPFVPFCVRFAVSLRYLSPAFFRFCFSPLFFRALSVHIATHKQQPPPLSFVIPLRSRAPFHIRRRLPCRVFFTIAPPPLCFPAVLFSRAAHICRRRAALVLCAVSCALSRYIAAEPIPNT